MYKQNSVDALHQRNSIERHHKIKAGKAYIKRGLGALERERVCQVVHLQLAVIIHTAGLHAQYYRIRSRSLDNDVTLREFWDLQLT